MTESGFYQRGIVNRLFTTFVTPTGAVPSSIGSVSIQVTDETGTVDVPIISMTQLGTTNHYYFDWDISGSASLGTHLLQHSYLVDGVSGSGGEVIQVVDVSSGGTTAGGGNDWVTQDIAFNLKKIADNINLKEEYKALSENLGSLVNSITGNINKKLTKNSKEIDDIKEDNNKLLSKISNYNEEIKVLIKNIDLPEVDLNPLVEKIETKNQEIIKAIESQNKAITVFNDSTNETFSGTINNLSVDVNKMVTNLSGKVDTLKNDLLQKNSESSSLVLDKINSITNNFDSNIRDTFEKIPNALLENKNEVTTILSEMSDKLERNKESLIVKSDEDLTKLISVFDENCQMSIKNNTKICDGLGSLQLMQEKNKEDIKEYNNALNNNFKELEYIKDGFLELDKKISLFSENTYSDLSTKASKNDLVSVKDYLRDEVKYSQTELMSQYIKLVDKLNKVQEKISNDLVLQKSIMEENNDKMKKTFKEDRETANMNSQLSYIKQAREAKDKEEN